MKWIDNLKIGTKLFGSFGIVVVLLVVVALVGYLGMNDINTGMTSLYNDAPCLMEQIGRADVALYTLRGDLYKYILLPDERAAARQSIESISKSIKAQMDLYRATSLPQQERQRLPIIDRS